MIRWLVFAIIAASIAAFVLLVSLNGIGRIAAEIGMVGWGFAALLAIRLSALGIAALGWQAAAGSWSPRRSPIFVGLRLIREAINGLLPVAAVGGDIIGGRLLAGHGIAIGTAMASILVDLFLQTATQGVFAMTGLLILWREAGDIPVVREAGLFVLLAVPALGGFFLVQRFGLLMLVDRGVMAAARLFPAMRADRPVDLHRSIVLLYANRGAIGAAVVLHLVAWLIGVLEIWAALRLMDLPGTAAQSFVIESLAQALRSAAFGVPGGLGVQEGGFVVLGALFGIPASSAVALSIVTRLPDIAIGVPALAAWQYLEAARLRR